MGLTLTKWVLLCSEFIGSTCDLFNIHDVHTNSVSPLPHYSVLLSNANLTLARGRRYGLVGRNGEGCLHGNEYYQQIVTVDSLFTYLASYVTL